MPVNFPSNLEPTSRSYNPGTYPQTVFEALNGATTIIRYGDKRVNSELAVGFANITDAEAKSILDNYQAVNATWDYVVFSDGNVAIGAEGGLNAYIKESGGSGLKWRYSEPPSVTSVVPGRSSVQCTFTAFLDG